MKTFGQMPSYGSGKWFSSWQKLHVSGDHKHYLSFVLFCGLVYPKDWDKHSFRNRNVYRCFPKHNERIMMTNCGTPRKHSINDFIPLSLVKLQKRQYMRQ